MKNIKGQLKMKHEEHKMTTKKETKMTDGIVVITVMKEEK